MIDKFSNEGIKQELQMLTGIVTNDVSFMYYNLVKDGTYFDDQKSPVFIPPSENAVDSFENWFNNVEEV